MLLAPDLAGGIFKLARLILCSLLWASKWLPRNTNAKEGIKLGVT
jgi:hypothetical protein